MGLSRKLTKIRLTPVLSSHPKQLFRFSAISTQRFLAEIVNVIADAGNSAYCSRVKVFCHNTLLSARIAASIPVYGWREEF